MQVELLQDTATARPVPTVLVLAWQEGLRMLRHPSTLLGLAVRLWYAVAIAPNGPRDAFDVLTAGATFFVGVPVYFAANLVASRDRRADADELLAATPVPSQTRVRALCLAALVPAAFAMALTLVGHTLLLETGGYAPVPGFWHLVTAPTSILGAGLLGVMVSRWLPVPDGAALVMVAMVAWNVVWANRVDTYAPLGTYMSWARWGDDPEWHGYLPGSPPWHVAYLLGLCAMAVVGAHLPGAALTALTVVPATLQLTV